MGCSGKAEIAVYGRSTTTPFIAQSDALISSFMSFISGFQATDEGLSALRQWSTCMKQSGYNFETRDDPGLIYSDTPTVTSEEIATRLQDLDCDKQASLTLRQSRWQLERSAKWMDDNSAELQEIMRLKSEYLKRLAD